MFKLLLLSIVMVAGAWLYPAWHEDVRTPCAALDQRITALAEQQFPAQASRLKGVFTSGFIASALSQTYFAALPPDLACVAAYWKTMQDPDLTHLARGIAL